MEKRFLISGFSLLEIMIVVALLAGLSLVVMNLTKQSNKTSAKLQFDTDITLSTNEMNAILSDPVKCLTTFATTANPTSINNGKFYTSESGLAPEAGYGNSGLRVLSYSLTGTSPDGILTITFQNKNILKGSAGPDNVLKRINLYIEGTPGAITKCRALSTSTTDIWTHGSATDANNIFYNGGVRAGDETQTNVCDDTSEGTQRYNKSLHAIEFCGYNAGPPVSYSWRSVSSGGDPAAGMTWKNVTALRANGGTYTNDTGRSIYAAASGNCCGNSDSNVYINGVHVSREIAQWNGGAGWGATGMWLIPAGATYSFSFNNGLYFWWELRP